MLISEYLQTRNITSVATGSVRIPVGTGHNGVARPEDSGFAKELQALINKKSAEDEGVEFSKHAALRAYERQIDLTESDTLDRLNKAVEMAESKGANETLVIIDSNAFLVSVRNNKVITALSRGDMQGNVFTNIDSTVIM